MAATSRSTWFLVFLVMNLVMFIGLYEKGSSSGVGKKVPSRQGGSVSPTDTIPPPPLLQPLHLSTQVPSTPDNPQPRTTNDPRATEYQKDRNMETVRRNGTSRGSMRDSHGRIFVKPTADLEETFYGGTGQLVRLQPSGFLLDSRRCVLPSGRIKSEGHEGADAKKRSSTQTRWQDMVVGILTDPQTMTTRLEPAMRTWLRGNFHTFLFYTEAASDASNSGDRRRARDTCQKVQNGFIDSAQVTCVFLAPPGDVKLLHPPGAWKNTEIVRFWAVLLEVTNKGRTNAPTFGELAPQVWKRMCGDGDTPFPHTSPSLDIFLEQWGNGGGGETNKVQQRRRFLIADDDSAFIQSNLVRVVNGASAKAAASGGKEAPLYAGHSVMHCVQCRNQKKRFPFAFGGTGIIFDANAITQLATGWATTCRAKTPQLPGDERLGLCAKLIGISLTETAGATENVFAAFGEGSEGLFKADHYLTFPWAFHRIVKPDWFYLLGNYSQSLCPLLSAEQEAHASSAVSLSSLKDRCCWPNLALWLLDGTSRSSAQNTRRSQSGYSDSTVDLFYPSFLDPKFTAHREYQEKLQGKGANNATTPPLA